jgi:hypothetical protein
MVGAAGGPATAKPPARPGSVTGVALAVTKPGAQYVLSTTWTAASLATSYSVHAAGAGGATLAQGTVTSTSWQAAVTASAGTLVTVTVTPLNGTRRGGAGQAATQLPDLTAPTGTFTSSAEDVTATVTQTALGDDVSAAPAIVRTVDWGDGTAPDSWATGTTLRHTYDVAPTEEARFVPAVTLVDEAGNTRRVAVNAVVVHDTTPPSGAVELDRGAAWAGYTAVTLVERTPISDRWTPRELIARTVSWGDGSTNAWPAGTVARHVYGSAGRFVPTVLAVDEAGNEARIQAAAPVEVAPDSVRPGVRVLAPRRSRSVRAWKVVNLAAVDAQTGVRSVRVRAVEQRAGTFYAYRATTRRWVKVGPSRRPALARAGWVDAAPSDGGRWRVSLPRLTDGALVLQAYATDGVGNSSGVVTRRQRLTRR